jgi:calcium-dependent protein kinase
MTQQFQIRRKIGDSLFGQIFHCDYINYAPSSPSEHAMSRQRTPVAIKCISLRKAQQIAKRTFDRSIDDPRQEQRVSELLAATGGHCNVLQTYTQFVERDTLFIVMEYCSGGDLFEYITSKASSSSLTEREVLGMMKQIVSGVHFLHHHGVAHRDLSLENVLLEKQVCKIADFGLSTNANERCSDFVGKEYYAAPEVVARESYDPMQADVWSLGIMLFMMLTGSPLFPIALRTCEGFSALERHGVAAILRSWGFHSTISPETTDLLSDMLQIDPLKRIHVDEILLRLDAMCASDSRVPTMARE